MSDVFFVVLGVYVAIIMGIAIWSYFRTETEVDFLAAGRSIGPIVGGAVLAATQISAGTFVGTAGRHYLAGVSWVWKGDPRIGLALALAMIGTMVVAAVVGTLMPLTLRWLKVDPALASSVFVTTATDVAGFLLFLSIGVTALTHL